MSDRYVYFIKPVGMQGPIKIGCSRAPANRLMDLATWSPYPLEIIGQVEGTFKDELFLQNSFSEIHSHHEWFHYSDALWAVIQKIINCGSIDGVREQISPTGNVRGRPRATDDRRKYVSYVHKMRWASTKLWKLGEDGTTPYNLQRIMKNWCGNAYQNIQGVTPTEYEIGLLDSYLTRCAADSEFLKIVLRAAA